MGTTAGDVRRADVYRRPYEGTATDPAVMRAYLDWEYGLVAQLERDGTHHFRVLTSIGGDAHGKLSATFADGLP